MIQQMLKAGYIESGLMNDTEVGTMQGGILSPLLSNVYLNDFDWYVGRMYMEPHRQCKHKGNDTRRLKYSGVTPKYNFRYADDWVILTSTEKEAYRLKRVLTKYFKNRLKLELSQEKTHLTDLRTEGIHFLGFVVKAEKKRKNPDPKTWTENLVGKPLPDMERLKEKIQKITDEVRVIGKITERSVQAAQIQRINSMIVGLAQYLQPSICSHALLWSSIIVTLGSINLRCKSLLKRSKIVIIGVRSQVVVPNKDIATHGMIQLIVRAELMLINQFLLEGMIESLYRSIIIRTAGFTHTLRNPT